MTYPVFLLYKLVTHFKESWASKWPLLQKYDECCEEMEHQLSIDYLLKRVMFLEKVMELNFSEEYFEGIVLHERVELEMMRQKREQYDNHEFIKSEYEKTVNRMQRQQNSGSPLAEGPRERHSPDTVTSFRCNNINSVRSRGKSRVNLSSNRLERTNQK